MFNREIPSSVMQLIQMVLLADLRSEQGSGWRTFPVKHSVCEHPVLRSVVLLLSIPNAPIGKQTYLLHISFHFSSASCSSTDLWPHVRCSHTATAAFKPDHFYCMIVK